MPTVPRIPGKLTVRHTRPELKKALRAGLTHLLSDQQQALLHVPSVESGESIPLVIMLHGSGADIRQGIDIFSAMAEENGFLLLAPKSYDYTWDMIISAYGPDIVTLNTALTTIFSQYDVDPARIAIGGFSDGASYALSLGLSNGNLFSHIIAFSPCFMAPSQMEGKPRIFISHGTRDRVLPIERCSQRIVPQLRRTGYDVAYHEFTGPHSVPNAVRRQAARWFMAPASVRTALHEQAL